LFWDGRWASRLLLSCASSCSQDKAGDSGVLKTKKPSVQRVFAVGSYMLQSFFLRVGVRGLRLVLMHGSSSSAILKLSKRSIHIGTHVTARFRKGVITGWFFPGPWSIHSNKIAFGCADTLDGHGLFAHHFDTEAERVRHCNRVIRDTALHRSFLLQQLQ